MDVKFGAVFDNVIVLIVGVFSLVVPLPFVQPAAPLLRVADDAFISHFLLLSRFE